MRIEGKTALITGGASGLGRATVEDLLKAGASVMILDLPTSPGEQVAKELGDQAAFSPADVTSQEEVGAAVQAAVDAFGGLHVAVSCAGIGWAQRIVDKRGPHDFASFSKVLEVNAVGTFNVMRLAAARMGQQEPDETGDRGVLINTASIAAFDGQTGQVAYAASKGAIVSMTLPVARDLAARQIRCLTIAPGTFETPLMLQLPEPAREQLADVTPHPARLGKPEEYAALVRHIVENPMLNGEVIRLDGALRMPFTR
jgi:NAD(P)-dependent dehydrogenase (short-subunit alcohol dehydrogenase family)